MPSSSETDRGTRGAAPWSSVLVIALCATALVVHFALTWISQAPLSILGVRWGAVAARYSNLLFSQRWTLFAPDPPATDASFLFRCRSAAGAVSPWFDPHYHQHRRMLSAAGYLERLNRAGVTALLGQRNTYEDELVRASQSGSEGFRKAVGQQVSRRMRADLRAQRSGYRLAQHLCRESGWLDPLAVQPRVVLSQIPPFSRRADANYVSNAVDYRFPWMTRASLELPFDPKRHQAQIEAAVKTTMKRTRSKGRPLLTRRSR